MATDIKFKSFFAEVDKLAQKDTKGTERAIADITYTTKSVATALAADFYRDFINDPDTQSALALDAGAFEVLSRIVRVDTLGLWLALLMLMRDRSTGGNNPVKERLNLLIDVVAAAKDLS